MQDYEIKTAARNFINAVRGRVTVETAKKFAHDVGFSVVFFNSPQGDVELLRYSLADEAANKKAFIYNSTARIIFIDEKLQNRDKLFLLIHEIWHIILEHISDDADVLQDDILMEIEANVFAHKVLTYQNFIKIKKIVITIGLIFTVLLCVCFGWNLTHQKIDTLPVIKPTPTTLITPVPERTDIEAATPLDVVYVTPSGHKFHRADCRYTKDKDCTTLTRSEAEKRYSPCQVCKP